MKKEKSFQSPLSEQLREQLTAMLDQSAYEIKSLVIDDKHFGNVVLEIGNENHEVRLIQDRGDVYVEKRAVGMVQWSECFFLSHNDADDQYYGLLLKAVEQVLSAKILRSAL